MSSLSLYTTTISNSIVPFSLSKSNWHLQQSMKSRSNNNSCMHFHESYSTPFSPLRFQKLGRVLEEAAGAVTATAEELPEGLRPELMPKHVAVIMDGNVRWATQRGLHGSAGHQAGVQSLRKLMDLCVRWGVKVLSVFAFSYDNWARPKLEVEFLIRLFERELKSELNNFTRTSGELRVSNFLLWQLAYTELLFVEALWPDFGQEEFAQALKSFQERDRRYGKRDV